MSTNFQLEPVQLTLQTKKNALDITLSYLINKSSMLYEYHVVILQ